MKAPDKVFFPNDINLLTKISLVIKQKGDVCYIRKDALLEWAKEHYDRLKCIYNVTPASVVGGKMDAYKEIIDKINAI